jgi:hypothetical protein
MNTLIIIAMLLAAPAMVALANAVLNRQGGTRPHKTPFQGGAIVAAVWGGVWMLACARVFGRDSLEMGFSFAFGAIYFACTVFLNWFIFTITDVSMHIQLLMQISERGRISVADLQHRYNKGTIVRNRIPRLLELGQLRCVDGRLRVGGRGVLFGALCCAMLRGLLGLPIRPEMAIHDEV